MKTSKKALLLAVCALALVAATVMGTMAYLTDTKTVNNTFTVGNITVTLDEAKTELYGSPVDAQGNKVDVADAVRNEAGVGNQYKLIPGHQYTKDPTLHVGADSEPCYLFVKVADGIQAIEADTTIADQMTDLGWTLVKGTADIYTTGKVYSAGESQIVFNTFALKNDADVAAYKDAQIVITGYAIQQQGFADANAAWSGAHSQLSK